MSTDDPLETGNSLKGQLLIASPDLADPNFHRSVVLMVQHTEDGALGLILNRPTDTKLKDVWEKIAGEFNDSDQPLYLGGPVDGPLMAVHTHEDLSEAEILPGVYLSVQKDNLNEIVAKEDQSYRLFIGHSGWAGGQLEGELSQESWLTTAATSEHVFHNEHDLWEKVIKKIADSTLLTRLHIKHAPKDPRMN